MPAARTAVILILAGATGVAASSACAQDVLDADLAAPMSTLPGGQAPLKQVPDFAARNRLITGDVAGGRGFRGSIGYTGIADFRDETGSDELFEFRAGSVWSDVGFINQHSTYQRLRFGQAAGLLAFERSATGATGIDIRTSPFSGQTYSFTPAAQLSERLLFDEISRSATLTATSLLSAEPLIVGTQEGVRGLEDIRVSETMGVQSVIAMNDTARRGLTRWDEARMLDDIRDASIPLPPGVAFQQNMADLNRIGTDIQIERREDVLVKSRINMLETSPYRNILERILERRAQRLGVQPEEVEATDLDAELENLRRQLLGGDDAEEVERDASDIPLPGAVPPVTPVDDATFDLLQHGERVEHLYGDNTTRFNELVRNGESHLRAGEYFRAENDFSRALRFTPGHPLATAGLAHSQLGAGLYLPAATTVRSLFMHQPEMIGVLYDEGLVPNRPRLNRAIQDLRRRITENTDVAPSAFLLSYVGRLLGDEALIREGLAQLQIADSRDGLLPVLKQVWLDEGGEDSESP